MDLLFHRYANPFILLDGFIMTSSLHQFIYDFYKMLNEDRVERSEWEFFLHKVFDQSWDEFKESIAPTNKVENVDFDLGATFKKSKNMLKDFTPKSEV